MDDPVDARAVAVGFVAAFGVTAALLYVVGANTVVDALTRASPRRLLLVVAAAACWLTAWSLSLRTVLGVLGDHLSVPRAVAVYTSTTFANNVTPFGQAGGEPFSAYLISRETAVPYGTGFASISSVDALHFVPSLTLGVLALAYVSATAALGSQLAFAAAVVVALAVGLPVLAYLVWKHRDRVEAGVARVVTPVARTAARVLPGVDPLEEGDVEARLDEFFEAIDRVAANPRGLAVALAFSALGWLALAASLWASLYAVGYAVPVAVVLVAVPVGDLAAVAPLPGGLGGLETLVVVVVVSLSGVPAAVAAAAALVHRSATYLLPMVLGGGVAAVIATD